MLYVSFIDLLPETIINVGYFYSSKFNSLKYSYVGKIHLIKFIFGFLFFHFLIKLFPEQEIANISSQKVDVFINLIT
jgi:hypothetical protein